jgi:DNA-binding CsgD family transcriptional regulator
MTYKPSPLTGKPLSAVERDILGAMAEGATDAQSAKRLFLAEATVATYVRRICSKLEAHNRPHAVKRGYQLGYLRLDLDTLNRKPIGRAA